MNSTFVGYEELRRSRRVLAEVDNTLEILWEKQQSCAFITLFVTFFADTSQLPRNAWFENLWPKQKNDNEFLLVFYLSWMLALTI